MSAKPAEEKTIHDMDIDTSYNPTPYAPAPQLLDGIRDLTQGTEDIHQQAVQTTVLAANADEETGLYIFDSSAATVRRPRGPKRKGPNPITQNHGGKTSHQRDFDKYGGAWKN